MTARRARFGAFVGALALMATWAVATPAPVSACVGGMEFAWAVAHTRGWIATATVVKSDPVPVGYYRVGLGDVAAVMGAPPALAQTTVAMGAACDQAPHVGDRILVLDDVAIEPPYDTPVAFVIRGADANAISAADVARALRSLPATDSPSAGNAASSALSQSVLWLIGVGLVVGWLATRRSAGGRFVRSARREAAYTGRRRSDLPLRAALRRLRRARLRLVGRRGLR